MATRSPNTLTQTVNRLSQSLRRDILPIIGRLPAYGRLLYALSTSAEVPAGPKAALFLALGYQISPIDLIPGFIPVIGQLDDLLVMLWGIRTVLNALPAERADEILAGVSLSRAQLDADTAVVRHALRETLSRSLGAAQRGAGTALRAGLTATAFLGYFAFYALRRRK